MNKCRNLLLSSLLFPFLATPAARAGDEIPLASWKRPIGLPLENPGRGKPSISYPHFDDGYWQGAPVGGFGAGTFSRSYRGDFVRWHLKAGAHKYQTVPANQFSVYQKTEGGDAVAQVLYAGQPQRRTLPSWQWNYPVSAGDYYALYPKAWFDYRWEKFPARLTVEQFSPILPNNYRETSYPLALYYWHAQNPSERKVTISILFSWTNMVGWFRDFSPNLDGQINIGNTNGFRFETIAFKGQDSSMKGIVFDRVRQDSAEEEWDGQFAIAGIEVPGVEITYLATFDASGSGQEIWKPFAQSGRLPNSELRWVSSGEPLAGAIAVRFTLAPGEKKTIPMVLAWDLPIVRYGQGRRWWRRYTDFFGTSGTNAWAIARTGLLQGGEWSAEIDRWQAA
ncbi:MAG TPA: GH116 family glycosyl-hydrolase, partial [Candidatus Acidoferrales bacterium]|nr:GH116 family glycosyl-hydrolase [Candidatus Acidoferrales bacterium]